MSLTSMTGFARVEGQEANFSWSWEVRSVNAKGFDAKLRLPHGFEAIDPVARKAVAERFARGNFTVNLQVDWLGRSGALVVNEAALGVVLDAAEAVQGFVPNATPPSVDGLLSLRGVLEMEEWENTEEDISAAHEVTLAGLFMGLDALKQARDAEGAELAEVLTTQVETIATLTQDATQVAATQPEAIRARLTAQVKALVADVSEINEERLVQEAAILMTKADIREELDRLSAHVVQARELLASDAAVGRKLDFLCQEFHREANTLCSKSTDVALTRIGLDLKAVIEQLREQVQNIE